MTLWRPESESCADAIKQCCKNSATSRSFLVASTASAAMGAAGSRVSEYAKPLKICYGVISPRLMYTDNLISKFTSARLLPV